MSNYIPHKTTDAISHLGAPCQNRDNNTGNAVWLSNRQWHAIGFFTIRKYDRMSQWAHIMEISEQQEENKLGSAISKKAIALFYVIK